MKLAEVTMAAIIFLSIAQELNSQELALVGRYVSSENFEAMAITGDYAIVTTPTRFMILDISNPAAPSSVSSYHDRSAQEMAITDFVSYHIRYNFLRIFEFYDPYRPRYAGEFFSYPHPKILAIEANRLYCLAEGGQVNFLEFDLSDPMHPTLLRQIGIHTGSVYDDMVVRGQYAYIAYCDLGLYVVDISDSTGLAVIGHTDNWGYFEGVCLRGEYAFVTEYTGGIYSIDISDPANPTVVGSCEVDGYPRHICNLGNYLFAATVDSSLEVVDISNPTAPTWIASYDDFGLVQQICADSNFIYLIGNSTFAVLSFVPTGIVSDLQASARDFAFFPNYPNPFNAQTTISYSLPREAPVTFEAFDIAGRRIYAMALGNQGAGIHSFTWNVDALPSGIYLYRIKAGSHSITNRCLLLK